MKSLSIYPAFVCDANSMLVQ